MTPNKKAAALMILALLASAGMFLVRVQREMVDFQVNYEAGQRIRGGETLYRIEDGHYQFKYPPFSSFLIRPPFVSAGRRSKSNLVCDRHCRLLFYIQASH